MPKKTMVTAADVKRSADMAIANPKFKQVVAASRGCREGIATEDDELKKRLPPRCSSSSTYRVRRRAFLVLYSSIICAA